MSQLPGDHPDRTYDADALKTDDVVTQLTSVTHRAELILMLLVREGIPLGSQTYAALGLVHDTIGNALDEQNAALYDE